MLTMNAKTAASLADRRNAWVSRPLSRCQAEIPSTSIAPVKNAARTVCANGAQRGALLIAAQQPQPDERGLGEEREQSPHGERRTENIADEDRVIRPVHAELEFLHDAGDPPHR